MQIRSSLTLTSNYFNPCQEPVWVWNRSFWEKAANPLFPGAASRLSREQAFFTWVHFQSQQKAEVCGMKETPARLKISAKLDNNGNHRLFNENLDHLSRPGQLPAITVSLLRNSAYVNSVHNAMRKISKKEKKKSCSRKLKLIRLPKEVATFWGTAYSDSLTWGQELQIWPPGGATSIPPAYH